MKPFPFAKALLTTVAAIPAVLAAAPIYAQEEHWSFQPSIGEDIKWNSNPLLLQGKHESLYGSITTPHFKMTDFSDTGKMSSEVSVSNSIYNQSSFNSTDAHGLFDYEKKFERLKLAVNASADYDTTLSSEISVLNIPAIGAVRHTGASLAPDISYKVNDEDTVGLLTSYATSRYEGNLFTDYHVATATPSYSYSYNPRNSFILSAPVQRYETDSGPNFTTDSLTPTVGWLVDLTPTLSAKTSLGARRFRQEANVPGLSQDWQWKGIYSADVTYKGMLDRLDLSASKDLQPYANGTEFFLNSFALTNEHKFNELFSSNLGASYRYAPKNSSGLSGSSLKSLVSTNIGFTYHPTEKIDVATTYQYREQELSNLAGNQSDNQFMLNLVYHPVLSFLDGNF